jgi:hypothetical protein
MLEMTAMAKRSRVALLRTTPDRVLDDYSRLFHLAGGSEALAPNATTILKDNIFVSEFNHDYLQWPLRFKGIAERWERTTPWGRLFARYRSEGHLAGA